MIRINNYKVAKYLRLSRDDGDDRESESIENQRDIIDNYIKEHSDELTDVCEYIDDGYTGTNFNRPGFKQMLGDIESGRINCIITKDLSRFGRDHIDTGYYLERYLPANAIRYIAIGDNVDTNNPDGMQFLTFKLSFNDYYAQDISNKIKSVKNRKIEKGEYQGGVAPYGYIKDENLKNHLIPDMDVSFIVEDIFDMYVNKDYSTTMIAEKLNQRKVIPPIAHLKIPGFYEENKKYEWKQATITSMLRNEVYIGSVVGRKTQKISHKVDKCRSMKKSEYVIVENKHQPLIDDLTWRKAQDKLNKHTRTKQHIHENKLKDFVFCKECGSTAVHRVRTKTRKNGNVWVHRAYVCSNKNSRRNQCTCKQISEEEIYEAIRVVLHNELSKIKYSDEELEKLYENVEQQVLVRKNHLKKKINTLNQKLVNYDNIISELNLDREAQIISGEKFDFLYNKTLNDKREIEEQIYSIQTQIIDIEKNCSIDYKNIKKMAEDIINGKEVGREIYIKLIEKIEFDSDKNIRITLTFKNEELNNLGG